MDDFVGHTRKVVAKLQNNHEKEKAERKASSGGDSSK